MSTSEEAFSAFLASIGWTDDPELVHTPRRFTELLQSFTPGPKPSLSTFPVDGGGAVVLRDLPFHSLCAHHLLPFFGTADIAYQPDARVGGFSGVARMLAFHARRPQLQERLARDLAADLQGALGARGVVVRLRARQLCMEMTGACSPGTVEVWASDGEVANLREIL